MPKPMLKQQQDARAGQLLSAAPQSGRQTAPMSALQTDRLLRARRSEAYRAAMRQLDAGGHVHNRDQVEKILDALRNEFPDLELRGILLGCVAKCYLGAPYEVHIIDLGGGIIEHYPAGKPLPGALEKARSIAIHGGYDFIEVYTDCCRAVSADGAVSVIPG